MLWRHAAEKGVRAAKLFDVAALSRAMIDAVRRPERYVAMRREARRAARRFDRETVGVPGWLSLIDEMVG